MTVLCALSNLHQISTKRDINMNFIPTCRHSIKVECPAQQRCQYSLSKLLFGGYKALVLIGTVIKLKHIGEKQLFFYQRLLKLMIRQLQNYWQWNMQIHHNRTSVSVGRRGCSSPSGSPRRETDQALRWPGYLPWNPTRRAFQSWFLQILRAVPFDLDLCWLLPFAFYIIGIGLFPFVKWCSFVDVLPFADIMLYICTLGLEYICPF